MKRLLSLLVVGTVIGTSGCGDAATAVSAQPEQFTQGGVSMEPTVKSGQVITARPVDDGYRPAHGDIVLFRPSGGKWGDRDTTFLKRVVAVGGETVACCDPAGKVTVDGAPLDEPYVTDDAPLDSPPNPDVCDSRRFGPVEVPKDEVFVLGDNRAASNDSRCAGPVPATAVTAVMIDQ
ncbi:signal peptidase I [Asanoa hainanensis]|uniref:Signal peptidase I n=1 Tax=Asanoa hainanensis TaxID=560556 RepID=A0A239P323_9ACTN|nr:signal peptidase I [Asanoa hainanensis]SNT60729.1 signal peptidase I [Asanoa hainanensis]